MILVGSKLFLRSDELLNLMFSNPENENVINWDLVQVVNVNGSPTGEISAIGFQIKGKTDQVVVNLTLWADKEIPSLCPVRLLLMYLHVSRLKTGYLFPCGRFLEESMKGLTDGVAMEPISYDVLHLRLKEVTSRVIERAPKTGTHTLRKTGHLLADWGGAPEHQIMAAAVQ